MQYFNVSLPSIGYVLPEEIVSSEEIESRLAPLYSRLKLPEGRLELITGIRERRFWVNGTLPGDKSIVSCQHAISAAGIETSEIGALIHASVCRDHLEPATACRVHDALGLSPDCVIYDVSNACLGLMNGVIQIANMIELGQIRAGLVVGTEGSRQLVETTIDELNRNETLSRKTIKTAIASLTIGSGSCAILLTHRELSPNASMISSAVARAHTAHHKLCHSGADEAVASGMQPLMETDSETLMAEGIATGVATFDKLMASSGWSRDDFHKTVCHQVGKAHRALMLQSLEIPVERDFATFDWLGNTGSVALPLALAFASASGHIAPGDQVGMLGIGSGINSVMISAKWQETFVEGVGEVRAAGQLQENTKQVGTGDAL